MLADIFAFINFNSVGAAAENASRLIFFEHNSVFVNIDFKCIFFIDTEGSAKLDRKNNAAKFVNFAYNTSRFHLFLLLQTPNLSSVYIILIYTEFVKGF